MTQAGIEESAEVRTHGGGSEVQYRTVDGGGDAKRLLVVLPRLGARGARMASPLAADLVGARAHQLLLGADTYLYFGPDRRHLGVKLAVDLVEREADRLGIAREDVLAVGSRFGGSLAMWVGMTAGIGRIVVDRPIVRLGAMVADCLEHGDDAAADGEPSKSAVAAAVLRAVPGAGDENVHRWLDRVLSRAALSLDTPVVVDVFRPDQDVRRFARQLEEHPMARVELHERDDVESFPALVIGRLAEG